MKQNLKIILTGIGMCIISGALSLILQYYFFENLSDWTKALSSKYLFAYLNALDQDLIFLCPIIITFEQFLLNIKQVSSLIKSVLITLCGIVVMIFIGVIIALFTWKGPGTETLIPDYYKTQPHEYYWTIFITLGILISVTIIFLRRNSEFHQNDRYDDEQVSGDILDNI